MGIIHIPLTKTAHEA